MGSIAQNYIFFYFFFILILNLTLNPLNHFNFILFPVKKNHRSSWIHYKFVSWKILFKEKFDIFYKLNRFLFNFYKFWPEEAGSDTMTLLEDKNVFFMTHVPWGKTKVDNSCISITYDSDTSGHTVCGANKKHS